MSIVSMIRSNNNTVPFFCTAIPLSIFKRTYFYCNLAKADQQMREIHQTGTMNIKEYGVATTTRIFLRKAFVSAVRKPFVTSAFIALVVGGFQFNNRYEDKPSL